MINKMEETDSQQRRWPMYKAEGQVASQAVNR